MLHISPVPYQPHVTIVHPNKLGACLILRAPEFVKSVDGSRIEHPADVEWEQGAPTVDLQYRWNEPDCVKRALGSDFSGQF